MSKLADNPTSQSLAHKTVSPPESRSAYTPGPWEPDKGFAGWHSGDVNAIAIWKYVNGHGTPVAWVSPYGYFSSEIAQANARLIAAAPALYESLDALMTLVLSVEAIYGSNVATFLTSGKTWDQARAALALVKGGQ